MNRETKSQQQLNLATLKRIDPATIDVVGNSAHVAVYKFDDTSKSWQRRDVEGSLFVVKRSEAPNYRILVLNRLSTENLTEDVTNSLLVQLSGPYMIYRNHLGVTTGIWFYEENEKEKISNLLNSIIQEESSRIAATQDSNVAALAGLLTSIKEQAAAAAPQNSYPPANYPPQPLSQPPSTPPYPSNPPYPSQPSASSPYPPHLSQPPSQPLPHSAYAQPPFHPSYPLPPNQTPPFTHIPHTSYPPPPFPPPTQQPAHDLPPGYSQPPSSSPTPSSSQPQLPPGDAIANLISTLQNLPPNLTRQNSAPNNMYPPPGHPTNPPNYNSQVPNYNAQTATQTPNSPPKAFAYDANSPFPKLLSPSNLAAKSILQQQQPPPSLSLTPSLSNPQAGLPQIPGRASPSPSSSLSQAPPPSLSQTPTSLNGSGGGNEREGRGALGGSGERGGEGRGGLSGSGGSVNNKMSKQQLKQALLNLIHDDRFLDLVYNEYVAQR